MKPETQKSLIEAYVSAYNTFDVAGMMEPLHEEVVFQHISGGTLSLSIEGKEAMRKQAETTAQLFREREQRIKTWSFRQETVRIQIDYRAVLAADLPNGMRAGEVLEMEGASTFIFGEGKIVQIVDQG